MNKVTTTVVPAKGHDLTIEEIVEAVDTIGIRWLVTDISVSAWESNPVAVANALSTEEVSVLLNTVACAQQALGITHLKGNRWLTGVWAITQYQEDVTCHAAHGCICKELGWI